MKLLQAIKNNIPNAITCLNLLCGALAIVAAFRPFDTLLCGLQGYQLAFVLMGLAAVADFLDGFAARLLHAVSPLGKELDSLSDCVSFGLAPAITLYNVMQAAGCMQWVCLTAMMIPVFGALRLARFNVDTNQATTFTGLPIPANAIFWIGFINYYATHHTAVGQWVVLAFIVMLSFLMVCNLRMFSLKLHSLQLKDAWKQYLLIAASATFVVLGGISGLACVIIFYVIMSLLFREK